MGINIRGFQPQTKELRWLSAVSAGILMCKIVYDLTGILSTSLIKEYKKLNNKQKLEWKNRGFSTFHAIVVAAAAVYLLLVSDVFEDSQDKLLINSTSRLSDTVLGVSIGYFLSDLGMIIYNYPALGGTEYLLHHGLSMYAVALSLYQSQAQFYILMILFTEITTPFVNLRWYLDTAGLKNSKSYVFNGVSLFLGWLGARIILFAYFFYHIFTHFDQVKLLSSIGFYTLLTIPPVIAMLNLLWFWKITRGMVKTLKKAGHSQ